MNLKHDLSVIALTHWDREWRFPFQKTRMMLVEVLDDLLELMERNENYRYFHLDGQTILLEDYCEVRPQNKPRIRKLVEAGRLLIGPWYSLAEENQLAGESLVRNFLFGYKVGLEFGGVMDCGYSPNSWGQVSQMPQIMRGFGIRSAIFYRGISADQVPGNFYIWKSPDGTDIFGVRLGNYARSAFFHLVYRPVVHNRTHGDSIHQWQRGGKPLRISGTGSITPYHFCDPPMGWHPQNLEKAVADMEAREIGDSYELPFALAMHCNDSTGATEQVADIVEAINQQAQGEHKARWDTLPAFVDRAMAQLDRDGKDLPVVVGEMRNTLREGVWTDLYPEVQAARMPLKAMNRQSEYRLQRYAEPFATLAWRLGREYPTPYLEKAWRMMLANQAHDSFGGCGMDLVHEENAFRYKQINILSENVLLNSLLTLSSRIDTSGYSPDDVVLYVFNNLPCRRGGVAQVEVDFDQAAKVRDLEVSDDAGNPLAFQVLDKAERLVLFQHPHELPCRIRADRWTIAVRFDDVPAMGYRVFRVRGQRKRVTRDSQAEIVRDGRTLENEHLRVEFNDNGTFTLIRKSDGASYRDQNLFQDRGEVGDPWIGAFPADDKIITSQACKARFRTVANGPIEGAIETRIQMKLPAAATPDRKRRTAKTRPVPIRSVVRLCRGEAFVRVAVTIDNTVEDHILRVLMPTDLPADTVQVEMPFDVVDRPVRHPDTTGWREPYRPVQPMRSFVDLTADGRGLAVLSAGIGQYEAVDSPRREIALTLLRCFRQWNSVRLAEYPDQVGSQLPGTHSFEYAIYPHDGDWQAGQVASQSALFNLPLTVAVGGAGAGDLPQTASFLEIGDSRVELAAMKKCEWDDSIILRLVNPTGAPVSTAMKVGLPVASAALVDMRERDVVQPLAVADDRFELTLGPRKIVTVKVQPA